MYFLLKNSGFIFTYLVPQLHKYPLEKLKILEESYECSPSLMNFFWLISQFQRHLWVLLLYSDIICDIICEEVFPLHPSILCFWSANRVLVFRQCPVIIPTSSLILLSEIISFASKWGLRKTRNHLECANPRPFSAVILFYIHYFFECFF